jgi:hypothetical protein
MPENAFHLRRLFPKGDAPGAGMTVAGLATGDWLSDWIFALSSFQS